MQSESGFTLLEIVVAVAILGIVMGIGLPSLRSYYQWLKFQGTVNQLVSDFHLARQRSVAGNKKWGIIFLPTQNKYLVVKGKNNSQVKKRVTFPQATEYKKITFPVREGRQAVFFKHLGNLDNGNGQVVLQKNNLVERIVFSSNAGELNVR